VRSFTYRGRLGSSLYLESPISTLALRY
jgi:hypothetical protein